MAADAKSSIRIEPLANTRRLRIGIFSEMFHCYMSPVMRHRGALEADTLPMLPAEDSAPELLDRFEAIWSRWRLHATGDGTALQAVVVVLLSPRFFLVGLYQFVDAVANFSQPIIISLIVRDLREATFDNLSWDFGLVGLLACSVAVGAVSLQQVLWGGGRIGMRCKVALSAAVYSKTLRLGNAALIATSAGQATNLVAIDVQRLEMSFTFFHMLWCTWLCICTCTCHVHTCRDEHCPLPHALVHVAERLKSPTDT